MSKLRDLLAKLSTSVVPVACVTFVVVSRLAAGAVWRSADTLARVRHMSCFDPFRPAVGIHRDDENRLTCTSYYEYESFFHIYCLYMVYCRTRIHFRAGVEPADVLCTNVIPGAL